MIALWWIVRRNFKELLAKSQKKFCKAKLITKQLKEYHKQSFSSPKVSNAVKQVLESIKMIKKFLVVSQFTRDDVTN
jgi:hypothetical protein